MISSALEEFVDAAIDDGRLEAGDVRRLQRDILPHGIGSRDEADVLIALDRVVGRKHADWNTFLVGAVVHFVVWTARPTGTINRETAAWLVNSLSCGTGPTDLAVAIAFEAVRESEQSDETLIGFVMRWARGRTMLDRDEPTDLAA